MSPSPLLPIVPHQSYVLTPSELDFAEQTATRLLSEQPELRINPLFRELVVDRIVAAPTFHVDDLKTIQKSDPSTVWSQERARLRAVDGDVLATTLPEVAGYETYCRERLGLGHVSWIAPTAVADPLRLAEACWEDRQVRRELVRRIRQDGLRYIHPYIGSAGPWELALLLSQASHRPVQVIAPPPEVTKFANDKGSFTKLVSTMFGSAAAPASAVVWNRATAAKQLRELGRTAQLVVIKLPSSASGVGNLLIPICEIQDRTLRQIEDLLNERLGALNYSSCEELLVTHWVNDLVCSPSAQLWIPPAQQGPPILEGLFTQKIEPGNTCFIGCEPIELPAALHQRIIRQCLQLARVYQMLGYIGRCSLDMLLVGPSRQQAEMEFIECNGRWGGTSLPMTLINRLFGDWQKHPFSSRTVKIQGVDQLDFLDLLRLIDDQLYRRSSDSGNLVLFNPQRALVRSELSVIALHENGTTSDQVFASLSQRVEAALATNNEVV